MEKQSKPDVNYGAGSHSEMCAICRHFQPPAACDRVEGMIAPGAWCKLFSKEAA